MKQQKKIRNVIQWLRLGGVGLFLVGVAHADTIKGSYFVIGGSRPVYQMKYRAAQTFAETENTTQVLSFCDDQGIKNGGVYNLDYLDVNGVNKRQVISAGQCNITSQTPQNTLREINTQDNSALYTRGNINLSYQLDMGIGFTSNYKNLRHEVYFSFGQYQAFNNKINLQKTKGEDEILPDNETLWNYYETYGAVSYNMFYDFNQLRYFKRITNKVIPYVMWGAGIKYKGSISHFMDDPDFKQSPTHVKGWYVNLITGLGVTVDVTDTFAIDIGWRGSFEQNERYNSNSGYVKINTDETKEDVIVEGCPTNQTCPSQGVPPEGGGATPPNVDIDGTRTTTTTQSYYTGRQIQTLMHSNGIAIKLHYKF